MNVNSAQMSDLLNMAGVEKMKGAEEKGELEKACADFESVLLNYMFQSMKKTVGDGGIFGESFQRKMYESLYMENVCQKVAEERAIGLGDALYRQLTARTKSIEEVVDAVSGSEQDTRDPVIKE
jgi:Rod binding domain-containing protein